MISWYRSSAGMYKATQYMTFHVQDIPKIWKSGDMPLKECVISSTYATLEFKTGTNILTGFCLKEGHQYRCTQKRWETVVLPILRKLKELEKEETTCSNSGQKEQHMSKYYDMESKCGVCGQRFGSHYSPDVWDDRKGSSCPVKTPQGFFQRQEDVSKRTYFRLPCDLPGGVALVQEDEVLLLL